MENSTFQRLSRTFNLYFASFYLKKKNKNKQTKSIEIIYVYITLTQNSNLYEYRARYIM